MGNRAVITTEQNFENNGLGIYLHWNGGRDSVRTFLEYCRLRGFRTPDEDDYGWARMCQVIGNFLGADGLSLGINTVDRLDTDNGDNGVYLIKGWEIVGRKYYEGEEQNSYDFLGLLKAIDEAQPEKHRIGPRMLIELLNRGKVISDIAYDYHYVMDPDRTFYSAPKTFRAGRYWLSKYDKESVPVIKADHEEVHIEIDGEEQVCPVYHWRDGRESILIKRGDREIPLIACSDTEC